MVSFDNIGFMLSRFVFIIFLLIFQTNIANSANDSVFTVKHGNTLYSISQMYGVTISELRVWNKLADNTIYPGQVLRVKAPQTVKPTHEEKDLPGTKPAKSLPATRKLSSLMIPYGLEIAALEQRYDRHIYVILSEYLKPGTFLVDVRVELEPTRQNSSKRAATSLQSEYILPGLPFMPEELKRWENAYQPGISGLNNLLSEMQLKKLNVIVYVDSSYYSPQLTFIEHLIRAAAKIENQRKDQIHVIPKVFPAQAHTILETTGFPPIRVDISEKKSSLAIPVLIISLSVIVILITLLMLIIFRKD